MPNEIPITRDRWLNDRKRDRLAAQVEHYNIRAGEDATELARLRGENERLRAALEEITGLRKSYMKCRDAHDAVRIAEAALAGKEQG